MNRRRFLQMLGLGAGMMTLDPEKLLWVPGQKTVFIPPPPMVARMSDLDVINVMTKKYITPGLVDAMWQRDAFLDYLAKSRVRFSGDTYLREQFIHE